MLCECGCGGETVIAPAADPRRGWVRGKPRRFMQGHNRRVLGTKAYKKLDGELVHRARAEKALGHPLPAGAVVHHADGSLNPLAPLVICENSAYHSFLHARMRIVIAGGNPNTEAICCSCKKVKPRDAFMPDPKRWTGRAARCYACNRAYQAAWQRNHPTGRTVLT